MATPKTVLDLGRLVKQKYPGMYDDLSDFEVGKRTKEKYPDAYGDYRGGGVVDSIVQTTARPFLRLGANVINAAQAGVNAVRDARDVVQGNKTTTGRRFRTDDAVNFGRYFGNQIPVGQKDEGFIDFTLDGTRQGNFRDNLKDSVGTGLDAASTAVSFGGASNIAKTGLTGAIKQGALRGARDFGVAGFLGGTGQALQNEETVGQSLVEGAKSGAIGAGVGLLAGAAGPIAGAAKTAQLGRFSRNVDEVQKVLNPAGKYTPTEAEGLLARGKTQTRGRGIFKRDVPTTKPTQQQETLAQLVSEKKISSKNTPGENIVAIRREARIKDRDIDEIISRPELNKPFNGNTLNKVFEKVQTSAKENLTFVSETTEEKAYNEVLRIARQEISKHPYNNAGLRQGIKAFNKRMETILGKNIYSGAAESVGKARIEAAKDVRTALNDFLADNLITPPQGGRFPSGVKMGDKSVGGQFGEKSRVTAGEIYRMILREEAHLLSAADDIAYRGRTVFNKSRFKRFTGSATGRLLKTVGLGALGGGAIVGGVNSLID